MTFKLLTVFVELWRLGSSSDQLFSGGNCTTDADGTSDSQVLSQYLYL